jgi:hypothetical protein
MLAVLVALLLAVPAAYLGLSYLGVFATIGEWTAPTGARVTLSVSPDPGSIDIADAAWGRAPRTLTFTASAGGGRPLSPASAVRLELPSYSLSIANPLPYALEFAPLATVPEWCIPPELRYQLAPQQPPPATTTTTTRPATTTTTTKTTTTTTTGTYITYIPPDIRSRYMLLSSGGRLDYGCQYFTAQATGASAATTTTATGPAVQTVTTVTGWPTGPFGQYHPTGQGGQWAEFSVGSEQSGNFYKSPLIRVPEGQYVVFTVTVTGLGPLTASTFIAVQTEAGGNIVIDKVDVPAGATVTRTVSSYSRDQYYPAVRLVVWNSNDRLSPAQISVTYRHEFRPLSQAPPAAATTSGAAPARASVTIHDIAVEANYAVTPSPGSSSASSGFADVSQPRSASVQVPVDFAKPLSNILVRVKYRYVTVYYTYDQSSPGQPTQFKVQVALGYGESAELTVNLPSSAVVYDVRDSSQMYEARIGLDRFLRASSPPVSVSSLSVDPGGGTLSFALANRHSQPAAVSWRFLIGQAGYASGELRLEAGQQASVTANIAEAVSWMRRVGQTRASGTLEVQYSYPTRTELLDFWIGYTSTGRISLPVVIDLSGGGFFSTETLRVVVEGPGRIVSVEVVNEQTGETKRYGAEGSYPYLYNSGGKLSIPQTARITVEPTSPDAFLCGYQADPPGYGPIRSCDIFQMREGVPGRRETVAVGLGAYPGFTMRFVFRSLADPAVASARTEGSRWVNVMDRLTFVASGNVDRFHAWIEGEIPNPGAGTGGPDRLPDVYFSFSVRARLSITNNWPFPVTVASQSGRVEFHDYLGRGPAAFCSQPFPPTTVQPGQTAQLEFQCSADRVRWFYGVVEPGWDSRRTSPLQLMIRGDVRAEGPQSYEYTEAGRLVRLFISGGGSVPWPYFRLPVLDAAYGHGRTEVMTEQVFRPTGTTATLGTRVIVVGTQTTTVTTAAGAAPAAAPPPPQPPTFTDVGVHSQVDSFVQNGGAEPQRVVSSGAVSQYQEIALPVSVSSGGRQAASGYARVLQAPPAVDPREVVGQPAARPAPRGAAGGPGGALDAIQGFLRSVGEAILGFFRWLAQLLGLG